MPYSTNMSTTFVLTKQIFAKRFLYPIRFLLSLTYKIAKAKHHSRDETQNVPAQTPISPFLRMKLVIPLVKAYKRLQAFDLEGIATKYAVPDISWILNT